MPDDLIGYEASSLTDVEAVLDGLTNATSKQVYLGTLGVDARAIAAVAASRADAAGGGGASFPDEWTVGADGSLFIDPELSAFPTLKISTPAGKAATFGDILLIEQEDSVNPYFAINYGGAIQSFLLEGSGASHSINAADISLQMGDGFAVLGLEGTSFFQVNAADFNSAFRVDPDGSVHIRTGTTIVADL